MDMNFRDWLVILGVLCVFLVIADAIRRVWLARRYANELSFEIEEHQDEEKNAYNSELPNGGARVIKRDPLGLAEEEEDELPILHLDDSRIEPSFNDHCDDDLLDSDELYDTVNKNEQSNFSRPSQTNHHNKRDQTNNVTSKQEYTLLNNDDSIQKTNVSKDQNLDQYKKRAFNENQQKEKNTFSSKEITFQHSARESNKTKNQDSGAVSDVLVVNMVAHADHPFSGKDILQHMVEEGLQYGKMNIFHRFVTPGKEKSGVIFSVANGIEPGFFEIGELEKSDLTALCFFMTLPSPIESMASFQMMIKSIQRISSALGGQLQDEHHNVLTQQTLEHYRERVKQFELNVMNAMLKKKASVERV